MDAAVVVAEVTESVHFLGSSPMDGAIQSGDISTEAVDGIGPSSSGGRILAAFAFNFYTSGISEAG